MTNHAPGLLPRTPTARSLARHAWAAALLFPLGAGEARAHAAEQGFVLLLPTDLYIAGGVATVALTVLLLMLLPAQAAERIFAPRPLLRRPPEALATATSCLSALALVCLVWLGRAGATDPLDNPLTLTVWTLWWIGLVSLQGLVGDIWRYLNPLTGPARVIARATGRRAPFRPPRALGALPGIALFLAFVSFLLADPTPTDPRRLAVIMAAYWATQLALTLAFGARWLLAGEVATLLMRAYARAGLLGRRGPRTALGLPGWQTLARPAPSLGTALFILLLLGSGSFDGLNETFWWLGLIGVNPLDFPGRSAIVTETLTGLFAFNAGLILAFALAVWAGERLVRSPHSFGRAFRTLAPSILPIALGYHIGHYLPTFLVDIQYAYAAASDPLGRGDDLLGLGTFYVTTGFFAAPDTVRLIWLTQAGAVVLGHVIAVLLAHGLAVRLHGSQSRAALSQAPLAAFMVAYTLFGLWLLASPRG